MATIRYVKPNANGGWDVVKAGHRRALLHCDTRGEAVARARDATRREGGGEVLVLNATGKVVREASLAASA